MVMCLQGTVPGKQIAFALAKVKLVQHGVLFNMEMKRNLPTSCMHIKASVNMKILQSSLYLLKQHLATEITYS